MSARKWVRSLASITGLRIWCCCKPQRRLQTWLASGVAVAVVQVGSCSSDSTLSLGTSICRECSPKKKKKYKKQRFIVLVRIRFRVVQAPQQESFPSVCMAQGTTLSPR